MLFLALLGIFVKGKPGELRMESPVLVHYSEPEPSTTHLKKCRLPSDDVLPVPKSNIKDPTAYYGII
jgi:hypothetical protein